MLLEEAPNIYLLEALHIRVGHAVIQSCLCLDALSKAAFQPAF